MRIIAVIGASSCDEETAAAAREVGKRIAEAGCVLVTGGLGGVMEAASQGAKEGGGLVIGILPTDSMSDANRHVDIPIVTGMGDARNAIIANTAEAFIAVAGSYGTLSEIAFALKRGKTVAALGSWEVDPAIHRASTPEEAVRIALG